MSQTEAHSSLLGEHRLSFLERASGILDRDYYRYKLVYKTYNY